MTVRETTPDVLEVAPSLFVTAKGAWVSELPPGAQIIGHLGLPAPDIGAKQQLLSGEVKQTISDKLGLSGDTKQLFSTAWDIGSIVVGAYGYIAAAEKLLKVVGALPTYESPEMKALKDISQKVAEAVNLLKLSSEVDIASKLANIKGARDAVEEIVRNFLHDPTPEEWEDLRIKLDTLHTEVTNELFDPAISLSYMKTGWDPKHYLDTPWYYAMYMPGFESSAFAPSEKGEIPVLGKLPPGAGRWDYRPWLGILGLTVVTLMIGNLALDPACRTTGFYRPRLKAFADGLRVIAHRMLAGVQVARELDLHKSYTNYQNGWGYDVLADGWPVGAADSVSGAAIFDARWKPSEHGLPILATIKGVNLAPSTPAGWGSYNRGKTALLRGDPPPLPWTFAYFGALKQAALDRDKAYFALTSSLPVYELYALAKAFDDLATPPKESETISFQGPEWVGVRVPAGTKEVDVGGDQFCDKKSFTAEVFHVRRTATIKVAVQPKLFQWGSHRIDYRFYLESYETYSQGPYGVRVDQKALETGAGTVYLKARVFDWEIEKPLSVSNQLTGEESVVYVIPPGLPLNGANEFHLPPEGLKVGSIAMQPAKGGPVIADVPLEERKGRLSPTGETKALPFHYERTDEDGIVTFVVKMDLGQSNSVVWLIVEEPIGSPLPGSPLSTPAPSVIRSGIPLAMIGIEHYLPHSYFAYTDYCHERALKSLTDTFHVAQTKGLPIPHPEPGVDRSYAEYVFRIGKEIQAAAPRRRPVE